MQNYYAAIGAKADENCSDEPADISYTTLPNFCDLEFINSSSSPSLQFLEWPK